MTPLGWLAVAAAVLLTWSPSRSGYRAARLAGAGRLADDRTAPSSSPTRRASDRAVAVCGAAGTAVTAVALVAGGRWPLAVAVTAAGATATVLVRGMLGRRRILAAHRTLLAAVRILIAELEAGSRPATAFTAAASAGPEVAAVFRRAADLAGAGSDPAEALLEDPRDAVRAVGLAWRLGHDTGAALASVLCAVSTDLAAADTQRRSVAVALAGPRSSAVVLALLPAVGIVLGTAMGAAPLAVLVDRPAGQLLACAGVLLDVAGVLWVRAVLRRAERA